MRITVSDVRASRIPNALGLCATDARIVAYINEATERLLRRGLFWGAFGRYRLCADDSCVTLPPQLASIEKLSICGEPFTPRDYWFEFMANGPGPMNGACSGQQCAASVGCSVPGATLRGHYPTFADINPTGKKVNLICDLVSDSGKTILVLGYDDNGNWIRTSQSGTIKDGELIVLAQAAGTISTNLFSSVTDVQLPGTLDGQVWMYEYKVADATKRLIANYQYFETRPSYPRYLIPGLCGCGDSESSSTAVEIIARHEFVPVQRDTDYLILGNIPALKEMMQAISQAEKTMDPLMKNKIIASGLAMAMSELDFELQTYTGSSGYQSVNWTGSSVLENDPVGNII